MGTVSSAVHHPTCVNIAWKLLPVSALIACCFPSWQTALLIPCTGAAIYGCLYVRDRWFTPPVKVPNLPPVPKGKIRICGAGWTHSNPTSRAHYIAADLAQEYPDRFETWFYWDWFTFLSFKQARFGQVASTWPKGLRLDEHQSSPFVWLEHPDGKVEPLGGWDEFRAWVRKQRDVTHEGIRGFCTQPWSYYGYFRGTSWHYNLRPGTVKPTPK